MIRLAGDPARLRPHCKTHKMREIIEMLLTRGVSKHKCATLAEAEMLAEAGAKDIFLAYNLVGPNIARAVKFVERYPDAKFSVTADDEQAIAALDRAMISASRRIEVLVDIDTGLHRTGVPAGGAAEKLYAQIASSKGLAPGGLHHYDGHNGQTSLDERTQAVAKAFEPTLALRDVLVRDGVSVPRIVAGGTGSFPVFAKMNDPALDLSPGTCVLHDAGYAGKFPDLRFAPAAVLLTRVISRPTADRVTCDLGYKACASDPPAGSRLTFPDLPEARELLQNEEHLVLAVAEDCRLRPGDELIAIPRHICPTSALHKQAYVVSGGRVVGTWSVAARDRQLTI
jgi:D-serine deaminase-like pyridoxal phosphate-dependent protein